LTNECYRWPYARSRPENYFFCGAAGADLTRGIAYCPQHILCRAFIFVMERIEEGFRILSRLPLPTRPRGYINSMPVYLHDQGDLNSRLETYASSNSWRACAIA